MVNDPILKNRPMAHGPTEHTLSIFLCIGLHYIFNDFFMARSCKNDIIVDLYNVMIRGLHYSRLRPYIKFDQVAF